MGVHSLWNILEPSSRPVRLESLSRRKMAVDASIWIYQFLKAVRSQEGHSLHASHVVGFFRRICKLLYFGIQPVFVFDGGAPLLKKEVIRQRKERRQGKRSNAETTAAKLLALQLQKNVEAKNKKAPVEKDDIEYRYLEEFEEGRQLEKPKESFKGGDEYELPAIEGFIHEKNDTRLTSAEEYKDATEQLYDELEGIDLNTIDPASPEFDALPLTTQYMVLSQLRLRSRLRMGYSKEQLEDIFPESMNFSKFQIQMVQKRNYFTQRLMNISGMSANDDKGAEETRRIASEKDRAYKIQKTEGGWALSLDDTTGMSASNPVDIEREMKREMGEPLSEEEEDFEWEDVDLTSKEKKRVNQSISALPLPPAPEDMGESTIRAFTFSPSKSKSKPEKIHEDEDEYEDSQLAKMEEMELLEAIQKSKQDLRAQQELEKQIVSQKAFVKGPEEDINFEDIPFAFNSISKKAVENSSSLAKPPAPVFQPPPKVQEQKLRTEMDHLLMFDTSKSSLLGSPTKKIMGTKDNKDEKPKDQEPNGPKEQKEQYDKKDSSALEKKTPLEVPSWFQNKFLNPYNAKKQDEITKKNDKSVGLVSWGEAQEILAKEEEEESKKRNDEEDDVRIVESNVIEILDSDEEKPELLPVEPTVEVEPTQPLPEPESLLDYEFYESEEEQLNEQLEKEEEEHENFQRELNPQIINRTFIETEQELRTQQKKELRDADEVTVTMVREVQELLARFGIPYITAPMEAEAQCAELLKLRLVDGIITDDSDVFLFGGDKVYRNMFHEKHYVEFYSGKELEKQGLDAKKLIELAHLLGSDYTEGLKSIGPVSAMEIIANFGDLEKFRDWFIEGQFDVQKQKKENTWERSLRKKMIKNDVILNKAFPDKRVDQAYLAAEVDHDTTEFVWGTPDLDRLRSFLMSTVGWSQERVDQVLVPLIRDLNKKKREGTQATLGEFYDIETMAGVKRKKSNKRMTEARAKMRKK